MFTVHQGLGRERHWVCLEQPFLQSNTYGRHGCIPIYFFVYFHTLHFIVSSSLDYNDKTIKWEEMVVERGFKNLAWDKNTKVNWFRVFLNALSLIGGQWRAAWFERTASIGCPHRKSTPMLPLRLDRLKQEVKKDARRLKLIGLKILGLKFAFCEPENKIRQPWWYWVQHV